MIMKNAEHAHTFSLSWCTLHFIDYVPKKHQKLGQDGYRTIAH